MTHEALAVESAFLQALGRLLGSNVVNAQQVGDAVYKIDLMDGRAAALKGVPRQDRGRWTPSRPWTELVAIDELGAVGAPVPRLLAADAVNGWLVTEWVAGFELDSACLTDRTKAWRDLMAASTDLERGFQACHDRLSPFATDFDDDTEKLAERVVDLFPRDDAGRNAWSSLLTHALRGESRFGPLDVRPANALLTQKGVRFLDLASIGMERPQKRLAAYAQGALPKMTSLLDPSAYNDYALEAGEEAALRLAFFDFLHWGLVLSRLTVAIAMPKSSLGRRMRSLWPDPKSAYIEALAMWTRHRFNDKRVEAIARLADPLVHQAESITD